MICVAERLDDPQPVPVRNACPIYSHSLTANIRLLLIHSMYFNIPLKHELVYLFICVLLARSLLSGESFYIALARSLSLSLSLALSLSRSLSSLSLSLPLSSLSLSLSLSRSLSLSLSLSPLSSLSLSLSLAHSLSLSEVQQHLVVLLERNVCMKEMYFSHLCLGVYATSCITFVFSNLRLCKSKCLFDFVLGTCK